MAIEAPISKFKRTNYRISIILCAAMAVIFAYDGYLSKYEWSMRHGFYEEHVIDNDGKPTSTMIFNRQSPPFFAVAAVLLGGYLLVLRRKKLIADENELVFSDTDKIAYDSIEKIDKTYFEKKGFFVFTYKNENGKEVNRKLSDRTYDNLGAILDHLVAKIS
ncbi:MAG TPA: hypothetical protein ENI81_00985 [Phycisphaerales bacterium]|nr:hypothetical protein [Phycisphaerales bacterium]